MKINKPQVSFANSSTFWESSTLDTVMERVKSYSLSRSFETKEETGYKHVHYGDIHTGVAEIISEISKLPSINRDNYQLLKKGDIILADASEDYQGIAKPAVLVEDLSYNLIAGLHTIALRPKNFDSLFLYYTFHARDFRKYGYRIGTGMKVFGISISNILKYELKHPPKKVQIQIGLFLRKLDAVILIHQQELNALVKTKQGFLQKMFPKEGQTQPEIRFKEFLSPWKEYKLSDLSKVTTGKAFKSTDFNNNGEYLVITNKNIQDEENEIVSKGDRINISDEVILDKYLLGEKNILVTMDGVNIGKTGRFSNNKAVLAQRVGRINSEQFEFIYQITKSPKFISTMNQISVGNAIKHISLQQISEYSFMAPTEVAERFKIGKFFKDIDELILLTEKKIKGLQSTKKGFIQKMFV